MARPKSDDKRNAILAAAIRVFAERGIAAATSVISAEAGVAEGTLFTYFKTKDELLNAVYADLKIELADALMSGFPRKKSFRTRMEHIWHRFVEWGMEHPEQRKVLAQLEVSERLLPETRAAGEAPFAEIPKMAREAVEQRMIDDLPLEFVAATMQTMAETTMRFMAANVSEADRYCVLGFAGFWKAIARR